MRKTIKSAAPSAEEAMAYGTPTFKLNGRNLVHFAAFKNHIGFYPTSSGISEFKKRTYKIQMHYRHRTVPKRRAPPTWPCDKNRQIPVEGRE
jgi:uncharacterized protein YdhG (YjbR/CyaY superfamily)